MVEPLSVRWVTGRCTYMVEPPVWLLLVGRRRV